MIVHAIKAITFFVSCFGAWVKSLKNTSISFNVSPTFDFFEFDKQKNFYLIHEENKSDNGV